MEMPTPRTGRQTLRPLDTARSLPANDAGSATPRSDKMGSARQSFRGQKKSMKKPLALAVRVDTSVVGDLLLPLHLPSELTNMDVNARLQLFKPDTTTVLRLRHPEKPSLEKPKWEFGNIAADLRRLPALERVQIPLACAGLRLLSLDLSFSLKLVELPAELFDAAPLLTKLVLRGCSALSELHGLAQAKQLDTLDLGRCSALQTLWPVPPPSRGSQLPRASRFAAPLAGNIPATASDLNASVGVRAKSCWTALTVVEPVSQVYAPKLRYVDLDGCSGLPDLHAWGLVRDKLISSVGRRSPISARELDCGLSSNRITLTCPSKHVLTRLDVDGRSEGMFRCDVCHIAAAQGAKLHVCRRCDFAACRLCATRGEGVCVLIVWPSADRIEPFVATLEPSLDLRGACREGVREKLRLALDRAELFHKKPALSVLSPRGKDAQPDRQELVDQLDDGLRRASEEKVLDHRMLQDFWEVLVHFVPDQTFPCMNGCVERVRAEDWAKHREKCIERLEKCSISGCLVRAKNRVHHEEVEKELTEAMKTWELPRLKRAIKMAKGHCAGCRLQGSIVGEAESVMYNLAKKIQKLKEAGVLARGNISIDWKTGAVNIDAPLPFAPRAPPDDSAEFKEEDRVGAMEIIFDLGVVLQVFRTAMIIEGHTGSVDPVEYYKKLADNRSHLIATFLKEQGVPGLLCVPIGAPGGGAKVVVRPASCKEVFEALDTDGDDSLCFDNITGLVKLDADGSIPDRDVFVKGLAADIKKKGPMRYEAFKKHVGHLFK